MKRARIWLRCAIMFDPVSPVIVQPAVIGWDAKFRDIDLTIERPLRGHELLRRMKGWATIDVHQVADILESRGRIKLLDDRELVVECETEEDLDFLRAKCQERFGDQIDLDDY
ncbi:MAG: hypothetical protein KJ621_07120 [Proteobacteria bacterium]|nr:hypothetical protein [Pseudomonadota bacterium]MBU1743167.1 hypothetical protein [Pseudomonadota bacterium]